MARALAYGKPGYEKKKTMQQLLLARTPTRVGRVGYHHLFPNICHVHYRAISPIVERTAKEFGLPYKENRTFFGAIGSHVRFLRALGR